MKITWNIEIKDIEKIKQFINDNNNAFVKHVYKRNVERKNLYLDKDLLVKNLLMGLITSQQASGPYSKVGIFLRLKPFPLNYKSIKDSKNIESLVQSIMLKNGLNRFINKIPIYYAENFNYLEQTNWNIFDGITDKLNGSQSTEMERKYADKVDEVFKGYGPKQARNFLQALGLTKYEVPIDSRITSWLNEFGFPVKLSSNNLLDRDYYHFIEDGLQNLCKEADILPCILDAAIFSSFDNGKWTEENAIY